MTTFASYEELREFAATQADEHSKFSRVENKLSNRPDLHAFLLLDQLCPGDRDMVCAATHDVIYLDPDTEALARVITPEQVIELIRCCVRFESEGLEMFA